MAAQNTTTATNQFQNYFSKQMLPHAVNNLVFNSFAQERDLPRKSGALEVEFFRSRKANVANVQNLTEGVPISTFADLSLEKINVALVQIGEAVKLSDVLTWTNLFEMLQLNIESMGEDCALKADTVTRDVIQAAVTAAGYKRFAQGVADWATLAAGSVAAGTTQLKDVLAAITKLRMNNAPTFRDNKYAVITPPPVTADFIQDTTHFTPLAAYTAKQNHRLVNGEVGEIYGGVIVDHTNPFIEDSADSEGDHDAAPSGDPIYSTVVCGKGAYGVSKLAGTQKVPSKNRASPKILIAEGPTQSDPLAQTKTAGWKAFYNAKALNSEWLITIRGKSAFAT